MALLIRDSSPARRELNWPGCERKIERCGGRRIFSGCRQHTLQRSSSRREVSCGMGLPGGFDRSLQPPCGRLGHGRHHGIPPWCWKPSTGLWGTVRSNPTSRIHTDQGSYYRATAYQQLLEDHKIICSMSAKGCCWDNAVVEGFFCTPKHELGLDDAVRTLISPQLLIRNSAFWIDGYYNRECRHSTIAYLSPIDYEQQFINALTLIHVEP